MRLTATGLGCVRGGRPVFQGMNFAVGSGEALLVTGPNGAGKSSLLRLVAGLLRPAAGRIELAGGAAEASIGEQAHYLGHLDALKSSLSVEENLSFWAAFLASGEALPAAQASASTPRRERTQAALTAVGLDGLGHLPALYLSAGQRRRLSLARLIIVPRPIWLLDEPTSALDAAAQDMLAQLMRGHLDSGGLIVAATHGPIGLEAAMELRLGLVPGSSPHSSQGAGKASGSAGPGSGPS